MPELPEVEAIRRYLTPLISNEVITEVKAFHHTVIRNLSNEEFEVSLLGATLDQIERFGKFLRFSLRKSDFLLYLYIDHGLTGRLAWLASQKVPKKTVVLVKFRSISKTMI